MDLLTNKKGETYALLQKMYDAGYPAGNHF